jgi:hypothetical protein
MGVEAALHQRLGVAARNFDGFCCGTVARRASTLFIPATRQRLSRLKYAGNPARPRDLALPNCVDGGNLWRAKAISSGWRLKKVVQNGPISRREKNRSYPAHTL